MNELQGLQGVLAQLYNNMLPQCGALVGVAQATAGFAALWYIGARVWAHIAKNEPVEVWPLLRPFAIGGVIVLYPYAIGLLNGILQPTVTETAKVYANNNAAIDTLLMAKEAALKQTVDYQLYVGANGEGNEALWEAYSGNAGSISPFSGITNAFQFAMAKAYYNFKNSIKEWLSEVLQLLYEAAALCVNTIRTFQLIVLAMLGPLALGFSVFDGWQGSLSGWLARYVHVFLWLPVANIFGSLTANIQVNMLQLDLNQIQTSGRTYFSSMDAGYLIFLILAIVGYFTVPTVAGYIVRADGSGVLGNGVTRLVKMAGGAAMTAAGPGGAASAAALRQAEQIKGN
ncbi:MAG TPA: conjugative transposon protein TraJ [Puia sp.]|uniref:conjugative transposon protein TraJ n=1 Tax=Puia sp. TaxID=2045100 RepID=UPI002BA8CD3E|nr:conjugative transposon protein TraJ [Puia sp.]HVU97993.1 conjugative transposon protein TraJ [Puia sp.]